MTETGRERSGRGTRADWRDVHGIVAFDKPVGMSSNRALQQVRRLYRARKAGHTGSLDPLASGLLPLCFGEATKLSGRLLDAAKTYEVTGRLGQRTETGDAEGAVVETSDWRHVDRAMLADGLSRFVGRIEQVPPMYSALKHQGRRLYELARRGESIERPAREVSIFRIELLDFDEADFSLRVRCSKGTYIRTLIEDIGAAVASCAHVRRLRRTAVGPFNIEDAVTLQALERAARDGCDGLGRWLIAPDRAVSNLPAVALDADAARRICHGQTVALPDPGICGQVRLYDERHGFLGLGEADASGLIVPRRLFPGLQTAEAGRP